ncbi:MAG: Hsp33 family molecular chaperone HslO [Endozoicomonas sp.]
MSKKDIAQRFLFDDTDIRGEITSLDSSFREALAAHNYPLPVRALLGELVAAAVLLSSTLKFEGILSLQAKGDGPLSLLMVECTDQKTFRALARWEGELKGEGLSSLLGQGQMVMTIDPHKGNRYQGIVPLHHDSLADSLAQYFEQSEQLPTRFWLTSNGDQCRGMLLQAMPASVEPDAHKRDESWARITLFADTVKEQEMLELDTESLLTRLFQEEEVRLFDAEPVSFSCNCSRQRSARIIQGLGREEAESIVAEQGQLSMDCQFCSQQYIFDASDVQAIFDNREPRPH